MRILPVVLACLLPVAAQEPPPESRYQGEQDTAFRMTIEGDTTMEAQGQKQQIITTTGMEYSHLRKEDVLSLRIDRIFSRVQQNDVLLRDSDLSLRESAQLIDGKKESVKLEDADEETRKMLRAAFGKPVCAILLGPDGGELSRKIEIDPLAQAIITESQIESSRIFHPPFPEKKEEWTSASSMSIGYGRSVTGELTYKKKGAGKAAHQVKVSVSGSLDKVRGKGPPQIEFQDVVYEIKGEQVWDTRIHEWVSGRLEITAGTKILQGGKVAAESSGTMIMTLERLK